MIKQEKRFLEITGLTEDLSQYPIKEHAQQKTSNDKSKEFGQVFTPLSLVDRMLEKCEDWDDNSKTILDLCAGCGQFGIRILRKKLTINPNINIEEFIKEKLFFSEIQISSCIRLLYIFGPDINLFCGDSRKLDKLPDNMHGVWYLNPETDDWVNITTQFKNTYQNLTIDSDFGHILGDIYV